jgi:hypothetical protein
MKFYKRQSISNVSPFSNAFAVEADGRIVTNTTVEMETPSGKTQQRSKTPALGSLRFNTEIGFEGGELEVFVRDRWEIVKTNRQAEIVQQTFYGNYLDTYFGPLSYSYLDQDKPQNVQIYIENVYQIPENNYVLQNSQPLNPLKVYGIASGIASTGDFTIPLQSVKNFKENHLITGTNIDSTCTITSVNLNDKTITIDKPLISNITTGSQVTINYNPGTYVSFKPDSLPAPTNKPITVLQGVDGYCYPFEV